MGLGFGVINPKFSGGLCCDGEALWVTASDSPLVHLMDPATGGIRRSFGLDGAPMIEIVEGYLWAFGVRSGVRVLRKIVP